MARQQLAALGLVLLFAGTARADFVIDVNFSGNSQFQQSFEDAADVWEGLLSGYQNGIVTATSVGSSYSFGDQIDTLFIDASVVNIDGPGGILGSAGPR
ncbi:MAG: peptidase, partial [Planctomycetota bacterium]